MKPGRKLDILVAHHVLGCKVYNTETAAPDCGCDPIDKYGNRPHGIDMDRHLGRYSTDDAASDAVRDEMVARGCGYAQGLRGGVWEVWFGGDEWVKGETMAHARCLAALKAVGYEVEE